MTKSLHDPEWFVEKMDRDLAEYQAVTEQLRVLQDRAEELRGSFVAYQQGFYDWVYGQYGDHLNCVLTDEEGLTYKARPPW